MVVEAQGRRDPARAAVALAAGAVALAVYLRTLAPGITSEDSGELTAAAFALGVPHPPGFPLWVLLAHVFTWLPAHAAWAINLSSACFAAITVALVAAIARALGASVIAATAGALCLAFSRTFWSQAVITEVYALNAALLALVVFAVVRAGDDAAGARRGLVLAALGLGLGAANHYPLTFLAAPAVLFYAHRRGLLRRLDANGAGLVVLAGLAPLALYAYLPWASSRAPLIDWGEPSTWARFGVLVLRRAYHGLELEPTWASRTSGCSSGTSVSSWPRS
ncbi:DUF2723 domain-containing protein [Myxococcota bacterium]|nr:DUF2723 domain-containing protein [Myxococcota bacterium]